MSMEIGRVEKKGSIIICSRWLLFFQMVNMLWQNFLDRWPQLAAHKLIKWFELDVHLPHLEEQIHDGCAKCDEYNAIYWRQEWNDASARFGRRIRRRLRCNCVHCWINPLVFFFSNSFFTTAVALPLSSPLWTRLGHPAPRDNEERPLGSQTPKKKQKN